MYGFFMVKWQLTEQEKTEKYLDWLEKSIKSIEKVKSDYKNLNAI